MMLNVTDGLSKLFAEIKEKDKISDLTVEYQKFAEWLRIEYARAIFPLISSDLRTGSPPLFTIFF